MADSTTSYISCLPAFRSDTNIFPAPTLRELRQENMNPPKLDPSKPHQRAGGRVVLAALASLAVGCGEHSYPPFDRINHLHNDTNQKLAEESVDGFGKFTSQQGGLASTLEKNLQARKELETTVANARAALDDIQRAFTTTDITWTELRLQVFRNLGMPPEFDSVAALPQGDRELSERIVVRQALVGAVGKDL